MQNFFYRLFRLQPGEGGLVFALGFLLFGNSLARQVSTIVSVSGFLNSGGVNQMLLVLLVDYSIVLIVAMLQSLIVDRFNRIRLMGFVSIAFAVVFVILRLMFAFGAPGWLNYSVMYLVAEQQFVLFPIIFWVLANDVSSFSKSQRIFPLIASGSFVGKLVGIGIAGISPSFFAWAGLKSEEILLFNSLIYVVAYIVILTSLRKVESRPVVQRTETTRETMMEGWNFVRDVPSFRYLMFAVMALALADTIIEFRFLVITNAVFVGQTTYQNFYSLYLMVATLLAFGVQTFLTNRFISNVHLKNVFFVFPIVVILGSGGMMLSVAIAMAVGTMLGVKLTRETVDESARKSFQALVPEERRGRVSMFMDSYLASIGTILACLITGAIVWVGLRLGKDLHLVYMGVAFLSGGFALWATFKLRKVYESSLLNWRLKRRQRATSSVLDSLDF
jgi:AAA family ATP:ADP antiporter